MTDPRLYRGKPLHFYVHEATDGTIAYLHATDTRSRAVNEIVYGKVLYSITLYWLVGGQEQYMAQLMLKGLL